MKRFCNLLRPLKPSQKRAPFARQAFEALRRIADVRCVIDVGVQSGTQPLIEAFPDVPHILVEPVGQWRDPVSKSYRSAGVEFRFVEAAASNVDGTAELELVRILPGDIPSHAHLKTSAHAKDPQLEYQRTPVRRMDSLIEEMAPPAPIFLKIDVDGAEMDVIEGCAGAMDKICAIAVEMSIKNFPHRVNSIMNLGFEPIEIYDMCYYDNRFVQADILFVNTALIDQEATGFYQDGFDISRWSEHKL